MPKSTFFVCVCAISLASFGCGGAEPAAENKPPVESKEVADSAPVEQPPESHKAVSPQTADTSPEEKGSQEAVDTSPEQPPSTGIDAAVAKERAALFADLVSERPGARDESLAKLQALGGEAQRDASSFLKSSLERQVRLGAAFYLLDRFDQQDDGQRESVAAALKDEEAAIRNIALQIALRSESMMVENLAAIAALMNDSTAAASSRIKAIRGLAKMPDRAKPMLEQIRLVAKSAPEPTVRSAAVFTISRVDNSAGGIAAIAERLKKDEAVEVRRLAAARLGRMEPALAASALAAGLSDAEANVRQSAADSLGRLGAAAVGPLTEQLSNESAEVRRLAVFALGKNGGAAASALPALRNLAAKDADAEVRKLAELTVRIIASDDARR